MWELTDFWGSETECLMERGSEKRVYLKLIGETIESNLDVFFFNGGLSLSLYFQFLQLKQLKRILTDDFSKSVYFSKAQTNNSEQWELLCFNLFICKGIKAKLVIGVLGFCGGENLRELGKQQVGQDIISPLNKKYNIKQMSDENKEKYQFGDQ